MHGRNTKPDSPHHEARWRRALLACACLVFLGTVLVTGGQARASINSPFTDADAGSYLVEACAAAHINSFTWNSATDVTNFPALMSYAGATFANGCVTDSSHPEWGMVSQATSGTVSSTGPIGIWSITAPSGEYINGLQFSDPDFVAPANDGLVSGWFGEAAGDVNGGLAANLDPTQSYGNFQIGRTPTYDCMTATAPTTSNCNVSGSAIDTFNFNQSPTANGSWSTEVTNNDVPNAPRLQALALGLECRTGTCSYVGAPTAGVSGAVVQLEDPTGDPAESGVWTQQSLTPAGQNNWVSGPELNSDRALTGSFKAGSDFASDCTLDIGLYSSQGQQVAVQHSGTTPTVDPSTGNFESVTPCGTQTQPAASFVPSSLSTDFSTLPSGTYYLNALAQDPAEYQHGVFDWWQGGEQSSGSTDPISGSTPDGDPIQIDNSTASVTVSSGEPSGTWTQASLAITVDATENYSGLSSISCTDTVSGNVVGSWTAPTITGDPATVHDTIPAGAFTTSGPNTVSCDATNAVGGTGSGQAVVDVDNQQPAVTVNLNGDGGTWLSSAPSNVAVSATETPNYSGVADVTCTITPLDSNGAPINSDVHVEDLGAQGGNLSSSDFSNGTNDIVCSATTGAGVTASSSTSALKLDTAAPSLQFASSDQLPAAGGWEASQSDLEIQAGEQYTGVQAISCSIANEQSGTSTTVAPAPQAMPNSPTVDGNNANAYISVPGVDFGDGVNTLTCTAQNGVGNWTSSADALSATIRVSTAQPTLTSAVISGGPSGGASWTRSPQSITLTYAAPPEQPGPAMKEIDCSLGGQALPTLPAQTTSGAAVPTVGLNGVTVGNGGDTETVTYTVGGALYGELTCRGEDTATVQSTASAWPMFVDSTAPTGAFQDLDSAANPTAVQFVASDGSGSGVKSVELYLEGTANGNVALLDQSYDSATGVATGDVPDDGSIRDGDYTLMAVVSDYAGNTAQVTTDASGATANVSLPLRTVTAVDADVQAGNADESASDLVPDVVSMAKACPRGETAQVRRVVIRRANRRRHQPARTRLERVCRKLVVRHTGMLKLQYGAQSTVTGQLIAQQKVTTPNGPTTHPVPVSGATIVIEQTPAYSSAATEIGTTRTDLDGRFSYRIPGGPSRTLTFLYQGDPILRTSSAAARELVDGRSTLNAPRKLRDGRSTRLWGQVQGGHIPPGGVQVQLWYTVKGSHVPFAPWATNIHTDGQGRWRFGFVLKPYTKGHTYEFQVRVPNQYGWAYLTTDSRVVTRRVR